MRICYVLPSPTFGMHQYTADLANRMAAATHNVALVTTSQLPRDRYAPDVEIITPVNIGSTGFSREGLNIRQSSMIVDGVVNLKPDIVHFTGPHLWNIPILRRLRRHGYPVIHTIHDLVPHSGMRMGSLLGLWNRLIIRQADHILVHGRIYKQMLLQRGLSEQKVTFTPLLHLFVSYEHARELETVDLNRDQLDDEPYVLFFGRMEKYKGIEQLLTAFEQLEAQDEAGFKLVLAGSGNLSFFWAKDLPRNTVIDERLIGDKHGINLFKRCSLLILPYTDATQSALVAAAYFFHKPVIVCDSGALAEYVVEGETGFVIEVEHTAALRRKLHEAFKSPERLKEMGHAGRAWYDKNRQMEFAALQQLYLQTTECKQLRGRR